MEKTVDFIDQCARRKKIRDQLLKEFNENEPKKRSKNYKLSASLCKRESPRSRFLKKEGNKPIPGDRNTYMPALKKAPKVKPDFVSCGKEFKRSSKK